MSPTLDGCGTLSNLEFDDGALVNSALHGHLASQKANTNKKAKSNGNSSETHGMQQL